VVHYFTTFKIWAITSETMFTLTAHFYMIHFYHTHTHTHTIQGYMISNGKLICE